MLKLSFFFGFSEKKTMWEWFQRFLHSSTFKYMLIGIGLLLLSLMIAYYVIRFYIARQAENKLNEGQKLYQPKKHMEPYKSGSTMDPYKSGSDMEPYKSGSSMEPQKISSSYDMKHDEKQVLESNNQNAHQDDEYQNWQMDDDEIENIDPKSPSKEPDEFENWEIDDEDV